MASSSSAELYNTEKDKYLEYLGKDQSGNDRDQHELRTSPAFALNVKYDAEGSQIDSILPQYGLLGFRVGEHDNVANGEPIMLNTCAPNSTFICGSQGSGKSYTLACMLEDCLLPTDAVGLPGNPVSGVVFHYDVDSAGSVAEAAYLCSQGIPIDVVVSKSNYARLEKAYKNLKGSENITVRPMELRSQDLSVERMNKLMAFAESEGRVPLYMEVIQRILREMAVKNQNAPFSYCDFLKDLRDEHDLSKDQRSPMNLRLNLLESFMVENPRAETRRPDLFNLKSGTLTIIDLSDPFVDAATVCVLFDICLSIIKERAPRCGLVVALDEAHKYMNGSAAATIFTNRLLTTIREQRHNGTRVIISTQEPTISPALLDLCSMSIVHRFSSPAWFNALTSHLGAASGLITTSEERAALLAEIMALHPGESFLFSPASYLAVHDGKVQKLGPRKIKMRTRLRQGDDGGQSRMARSEDAPSPVIPARAGFAVTLSCGL